MKKRLIAAILLVAMIWCQFPDGQGSARHVTEAQTHRTVVDDPLKPPLPPPSSNGFILPS